MTAYGTRRAGKVALLVTAVALPATLLTPTASSASVASFSMPGNGWNPADISNSGNEWDNMAVFDRTGRLNPTIRWTP